MAKTKESKTGLDQVKSIINKQFGDGAVMQGRGSVKPVEAYSTGIITIDMAFGCGGIPRGRMIELYGAEGSGKTTTALHFIAACQGKTFVSKDHFKDEPKGQTRATIQDTLASKFVSQPRQGTAAFIDVENALDITWAERIGVDVDQLLLSQPNSGEEALQIAEIMAKSGLVDIIVVDSVAALIPKAELAGEIGDKQIGAQAQLMGQGIRKLVPIVSKSGATIIFINQIRSKIGIVFGNPEVTPGGRALKFAASIRIDISAGGKIKDGDTLIGSKPTAKIKKNKLGYPFGEASYEICVGHPSRPVFGIDLDAALLDVAVEEKIIAQSGSFYKLGDKNLGNGRSNALKFLRDNPETAIALRQQIYSKVFPGLVL